MKKKVLITVNPVIVEGRGFSSMRKVISALDRHFDLLVIPLNGYQFKRGKVRAFRRQKGGAFEAVGLINPEADLWIVYSDGYYLNHRRFGFRQRRDYFNAQLEFHQNCLASGMVRLMVNTPEAEARTLKSWLATLNFRKTKVIPTYVFTNIDEVYDLQKRKRHLVVKPIWGGAATQVVMLTCEEDVKELYRQLRQYSDRDLSDYCFQSFRRGDEKRLWFAGGKFVAGRRYRGRETPWSGWAPDCRLSIYDHRSRNGFAADLAAAKQLCDLSGISMGSIDFIGDHINEINGAGTVMTSYTLEGKTFVDTRPAFLDYFLGLAKSL